MTQSKKPLRSDGPLFEALFAVAGIIGFCLLVYVLSGQAFE